jgi:glycosyltransferase involved in cell wall biosynthesis
MKYQNKTASILINNYNYAQFVGQAIESALNQTYRDIEIIVVDDGSTDNSRDVISSFGDRINAIFKQNEGQASAFNAGFAASKGEFIFLLDADDTFYLTKIEECIQMFEDYEQINWIFHKLKYINSQSNLIENLNILDKSIYKNIEIIDVQETLRKGKKFNFIPPATSGLCFRRKVLTHILPMPNFIKITSDNYVKFAALFLSSGIIYNKPLASQRIHQSNHFTFRDDVQIKASEIGLLTGYYLRQQFPRIKLFANKVFARGFGELLAQIGWRKTFNIPESSQYIDEFWTIQERLQYLPRISFHYLKTKLYKWKSYLKRNLM